MKARTEQKARTEKLLPRATFPTQGGEAHSPRRPLKPYRPRPHVWVENRADFVTEVEKFL